MSSTATGKTLVCFHCGEDCIGGVIEADNKHFCCEGCKMVYQLLNQSGLCEYYTLNPTPGINQRKEVRHNKFAFLEDAAIEQQLISFKDEKQTYVTFYLPQIHCSSCLYLLENLHRLHKGIVRCTVDFPRREASVVFNQSQISLRGVAELLTSIGYEPYISLNDLKSVRPKVPRSMIYQLGVAGFCFGNIMLLSFPEYLGIEAADLGLQGVFRTLNFILALPVFFYSSIPFFSSGWKALKHKHLNIDAPIALAILVTYGRSVWEVLSGTGAGYFDSLAGIVFFMLAGRVLQERTYRRLSFERDYTSYFPIAVTVLKDGQEVPVSLPEVKVGDTLLVHNEELIPADGILTRGKALIDYSFVTGESVPVPKEMGEIVYAGGKQTAGAIEVLVIKEVTQSYLTQLWSREEWKQQPEQKGQSFVHLIARYFTYIVFTIAAITATYWWFYGPDKIWNAVTAILIIACPCALLLSNTFTNGNILRILGRNKFYLRNAATIEQIARANHIVFDKTGTLTTTREQEVAYYGKPLTAEQTWQIAALAAQSNHPLSRVLAAFLERNPEVRTEVFRELPGKGIEGLVQDVHIALGSAAFTGAKSVSGEHAGATVYLAIEKKPYGYFVIRNHYRQHIPQLLAELGRDYKLSVISGDNASEREILQHLAGKRSTIRFHQKPEDKLQYIQSLQQQGDRVLMIGDGLNDAGALKQSDAGIAIAEDCNNFTPASDAIAEAAQLPKLNRIIELCKKNRQIVIASFIVSIVYNIIGIYFAVQGTFSPLIAAILMPSSSISILLITFGASNLAAKRLKL
jgi:Cu+-exporting ATPase